MQAIATRYRVEIGRDVVNEMGVSDKRFFLRHNPVTSMCIFQHQVEHLFAKYIPLPPDPIAHLTDYLIEVNFSNGWVSKCALSNMD